MAIIWSFCRDRVRTKGWVMPCSVSSPASVAPAHWPVKPIVGKCAASSIEALRANWVRSGSAMRRLATSMVTWIAHVDGSAGASATVPLKLG